MMSAVELILIILATARLTRVVTTDVLTEIPRLWVINRVLGGVHAPGTALVRSQLQYLLVCDWCASIYTGAAVAGSWLAWHGQMWFMGALAVLAASYVAGFLATIAEVGE